MMSKYRIIKAKDAEIYRVQQQYFWFFWVNRMGAVIPITSIEDARRYMEMFKKDDEAKTRRKMFVVE